MSDTWVDPFRQFTRLSEVERRALLTGRGFVEQPDGSWVLVRPGFTVTIRPSASGYSAKVDVTRGNGRLDPGEIETALGKVT